MSYQQLLNQLISKRDYYRNNYVYDKKYVYDHSTIINDFDSYIRNFILKTNNLNLPTIDKLQTSINAPYSKRHERFFNLVSSVDEFIQDSKELDSSIKDSKIDTMFKSNIKGKFSSILLGLLTVTILWVFIKILHYC